jgi:branched-chain amino acid transport system permease protein
MNRLHQEIRNPNIEIRNKSEIRNPKPLGSGFVLGISSLFRISIFGFRISSPCMVLLALALLYPLWSAPEALLFRTTDTSLGSQLTFLFIFAILALGLNVVVGYTGLLHLGIAAFFGVGAYLTAILTVPAYPFQIGFVGSLVAATLGAGLLGVVLGAPTLRLRGDYLALVTLGFGEVVRITLRNLEEITGGTRGLNPVPAPQLPGWLTAALGQVGLGADWTQDYRLFYYLALGTLLVVLLVLANLERGRLGRAWKAVREDELAATCMGIDAARVKLSAFALGAALAGLAGCLYATKLTSTAAPDAYDFSRSTVILCCVILGGLGSLRGTLLGAFLLIGFDNLAAPILDGLIQKSGLNASGNRLLFFSNWRLMIFGLALVITMRVRPSGLLPARERSEEEEKPRMIRITRMEDQDGDMEQGAAEPSVPCSA